LENLGINIKALYSNDHHNKVNLGANIEK